MAIKTKAELLADIISKITTTGGNLITGQKMKDFLTDFVDSVGHIVNKGLNPHNPAFNYLVGNTCTKDGRIYAAIVDNNGAFIPAQWVEIPEDVAKSGLSTYDNAVQYNPAGRVVYQGKIYQAKLTTQGNLPTNPTYWDVINFNSSFGALYVANSFFLFKQVTRYSDGRLYESTVDPNFVSTDFATELSDGKWKLIHELVKTRKFDFAGNDVATEFNFLHGLNTKSLEYNLLEKTDNWKPVSIEAVPIDLNNSKLLFSYAPASGDQFELTIKLLIV